MYRLEGYLGKVQRKNQHLDCISTDLHAEIVQMVGEGRSSDRWIVLYFCHSVFSALLFTISVHCLSTVWSDLLCFNGNHFNLKWTRCDLNRKNYQFGLLSFYWYIEWNKYVEANRNERSKSTGDCRCFVDIKLALFSFQ